MDNFKPVIGITQGDPSGVGMELIIKVFSDENIFKYCTPVLYANPKTFVAWKKHMELQEPMYTLISTAAEAKPGKLNLVVSSDAVFELTIGKSSDASGLEALKSLDKAISDVNHLQALVTAPIDKSTVAPHSADFTGHTGYLAEAFGKTNYAMILASEDLRVALVTEHIAITEVGKHLTQDKIEQKIEVVYESLRNDFNVLKPRIAVLGLNPHAGDNGLLGKEESTLIVPAIQTHFKRGKLVYGPYSADSFFGGGNYKNFDAVIAMYHDQGLPVLKHSGFGRAANITLGLPIIRTSVDHGTALDLAGKGIADKGSFEVALDCAAQMAERRSNGEQ